MLSSGPYTELFSLTVPDAAWCDSFFITLGLITGSDPYTFQDRIREYQLLWSLAWLIHIGSWLLIPALIGLVIGDVAEEMKKEQRFRTALDELMREIGIKPHEAPKLVEQLRTELDNMVNASKKAKGGLESD